MCFPDFLIDGIGILIRFQHRIEFQRLFRHLGGIAPILNPKIETGHISLHYIFGKKEILIRQMIGQSRLKPFINKPGCFLQRRTLGLGFHIKLVDQRKSQCLGGRCRRVSFTVTLHQVIITNRTYRPSRSQ